MVDSRDPEIESEEYVKMTPQDRKAWIRFKARPKCSKCGSANVYTNKDKTRVCRICGNREVIKSTTPDHKSGACRDGDI